MSASSFPLLSGPEEDALHFSRLLNVEERPFQRVSRRLLGKDSKIRSFQAQLPTPPPDAGEGDDNPSEAIAGQQREEQERTQWREDMMLEFKLLEDVLVRIQFLKDSNERERQRYAAEKNKIMETAQNVKDNTAVLRTQLEEAQTTLSLRKTYDELADRILSNEALKPRDEQAAQLEKLQAEIADLEQEGRDFGTTWTERRTQFSKITAEGVQMMKTIRGEKDEPDKEDDDEDAEGLEDGEASFKGESSGTGTPGLGGSTPMRGGIEGEESTSSSQNKLLQRALNVGTPATARSRAASPVVDTNDRATPAAGADTEMADTSLADDASNGLEDGEAEDSGPGEDSMDES